MILDIVALYALVQSVGAVEPVDRVMVAAALTEAPAPGRSGYADPRAVGDGGLSLGLWQIHQTHGLTREQRFDPQFAASWMWRNEFRRADAEGRAATTVNNAPCSPT